VAGVLGADLLALVVAYRAAGVNVGWREAALGRASACLPQALNAHLGQVFFGYFLRRRHGVTAPQIAALVLVGYAATLGWLALLALAAVSPGSGGLLALLVVLAVLLGALSARRPRRPASSPQADAPAGAGLRGLASRLLGREGARVAAARIPHAAALLLSTWAVYRCFGVEIPAASAALRLPVILVAAALPLTPQGLGTRELAAVQLLRPFAPADTGDSAVIAASASLALGAALFQALLGALAMPAARRALRDAEGRCP
jgi:hypothetical protein